MSTVKQAKASLARAFTTAHALEALGNYQDADEPLKTRSEDTVEDSGRGVGLRHEYSDENFWRTVLRLAEEDPGALQDLADVGLTEVALSEWSPRIPGLYWRKESEILRTAARNEVEFQGSRWTTYSPRGKSQMVTGGVGTLRLPPSEQGYRLGCVSASYNASTGAPVLIAPDVWEHHDLAEGCLLHGRASVQTMPTEWSRNFPTVKGLPKVCLVLSDPDSIDVSPIGAPVQIHPFSIMEYWDDDAQLLDFVYCQADSSDDTGHERLSLFFERYCRDKEREGRYLVAADVANPMWDAEFSSPLEMRTEKAHQLKLIESRATEAAEGRDDTEALIRLLSKVSDVGDLKRLSKAAGIPWRRWFQNGTIADEASRLVEQAVGGDKRFRLAQAAQLEFADDDMG